MKNVLYQCCTKPKDQFEPSRRRIHKSVSSEHGRGVAGHTPFQKSEKKYRFEFLDSFPASMPNFVKFENIQPNPY